jgi:membrane protein required for colicin V production
MSSVNVIDIMFLFAAGYGFFMGFRDGIINSVFRVISIVIALMAAFKFSPHVSQALENGFSMYNPLMFIVGFIVTFFITMWILRLAGSAITEVLEGGHLNFVNQMIGGTVLSLIFCFFYSVIIWFADGASMIEPETKTRSMSYRFLEPLRENTFLVIGNAKPVFQGFLSEVDRTMNRIEESRMNKTETKVDIHDLDNTNPPPARQ